MEACRPERAPSPTPPRHDYLASIRSFLRRNPLFSSIYSLLRLGTTWSLGPVSTRPWIHAERGRPRIPQVTTSTPLAASRSDTPPTVLCPLSYNRLEARPGSTSYVSLVTPRRPCSLPQLLPLPTLALAHQHPPLQPRQPREARYPAVPYRGPTPAVPIARDV